YPCGGPTGGACIQNGRPAGCPRFLGHRTCVHQRSGAMMWPKGMTNAMARPVSHDCFELSHGGPNNSSLAFDTSMSAHTWTASGRSTRANMMANMKMRKPPMIKKGSGGTGFGGGDEAGGACELLFADGC